LKLYLLHFAIYNLFTTLCDKFITVEVHKERRINV